MERQDDPWYPRAQSDDLWRPPTESSSQDWNTPRDRPRDDDAPGRRRPLVPRQPGVAPGRHPAPAQSASAHASHATSGTHARPSSAHAHTHAAPPTPAPAATVSTYGPNYARYGSPILGATHVNEDVDLDELDPAGRVRRRAATLAARRAHPNPRRRKALRIAAGGCAALVLAVSAAGTYAYEHLFGQVATESLDSLTNRPAESKADRYGNVPENILVLGSQTRDGQHGMNLGNSSKLGTDISDTAMLVHISAERKWATVVSIPRDLVVPRPRCEGRLDPTKIIPAAPAAMFDLAMNLGGPTCAVATVEQMTGIRVDHFVEITFNAFQALTDAVGGVTVCVPPPGINDPHYSGLVLGPGLHTISGPESLAFVRDRHGLANGTDLNRIRMQQMFVSSLFNKLASAGTLGDPITLYKIVNAITSNLTVDTGLDSIDAMVGLAGSVQSLKSHYIQFLTVPYSFDPTNQNRVIPGAGFDQVWADLRQDTPLPGSNAAAAFGTHPDAAAPSPTATATASGNGAHDALLSGVKVEVYNATQVPHLALYASENLKAAGMAATIGYSTRYAQRAGGLSGTEVFYPSGELAEARALAAHVGGTVSVLQSSNVSELTLVVGAGAPPALIRPTGDAQQAQAQTGATASGAPTPSISAESRTGDENICSDLPATVKYGGRP